MMGHKDDAALVSGRIRQRERCASLDEAQSMAKLSLRLDGHTRRECRLRVDDP